MWITIPTGYQVPREVLEYMYAAMPRCRQIRYRNQQLIIFFDYVSSQGQVVLCHHYYCVKHVFSLAYDKILILPYCGWMYFQLDATGYCFDYMMYRQHAIANGSIPQHLNVYEYAETG